MKDRMPWSNVYPLFFQSEEPPWRLTGGIPRLGGSCPRLILRIIAACMIVIHVVVGGIIREVASAVAIALLAVAVGSGPVGVGGRTVELTVVLGVVVSRVIIPRVVVSTASPPALAFMAAGVDMAHCARGVSFSVPNGQTEGGGGSTYC